MHQLVKRYETEGAAAFEPRSRRPHHNSRAIGAELEEKIVRLRKTPVGFGGVEANTLFPCTPPWPPSRL